MDLRQEAALEAARQRLRPDLQHRVTITPSISFYHCYYSNDLQCVFVKDVFKAHVPSAHQHLLEQWFFWMTTDNLCVVP